MNSEHVAVAETILQQMGGRMFCRMTGAKQMIAHSEQRGALSMHIGQNCHHINALKVTLMPSDTYRMEFYRGMKVVRTFEDVYAEDLQEIFTNVTGMYTHL